MRYLFPVIILSTFAGVYGRRHNSIIKMPDKFYHGVTLKTTRPLNIAHRGSSGVLPEHTVEAYERAIADGADVIECDVFVTKDKELVCLHDAFLSKSTNVNTHPEFADRRRTINVPYVGEVNDWFCFDFTLAELKTLRKVQSLPFRDPSFNGLYNISTLQDNILVAQSAKRTIGIYPEIKEPDFINEQPFMNGTRVEDLILSVLVEYGYTKSNHPCFIQCFYESSLKYIKNKTDLPLLLLLSSNIQVYGPHMNESRLQEWGSLFYGIGVWKNQIVPSWTPDDEYKTRLGNVTSLVSDAKAAGLRVHVYTFRNEDVYLAWDYGQDPIEEYEFFRKLKIDGYFTDFPKTFDNYLDWIYINDDTDNDNENASSTLRFCMETFTLVAVLHMSIRKLM